MTAWNSCACSFLSKTRAFLGRYLPCPWQDTAAGPAAAELLLLISISLHLGSNVGNLHMCTLPETSPSCTPLGLVYCGSLGGRPQHSLLGHLSASYSPFFHAKLFSKSAPMVHSDWPTYNLITSSNAPFCQQQRQLLQRQAHPSEAFLQQKLGLAVRH